MFTYISITFVSELNVSSVETDIHFKDEFGHPKEGLYKPSLMVREFLDMKLHLEESLQQCDSEKIIEKCLSLMASDQHNVPLFSDGIAQKIRCETDVATLIQVLGPYFTWTDYSILNEIVAATQNTRASKILSHFEFKTDYSQPLTLHPIAKPAFSMCPKKGSTHTVLAVQLQIELQYLNLHDLLDMRNFIVKTCEITPHALQLLAMVQGSSTVFYWMICRSVVPLVSSMVVHKLDDFNKKGIKLVAIYPNQILATSETITVGPLSLIGNFDKIVRPTCMPYGK